MAAQDPFVIGIDVGTSAVRAALVEPSGRVVRSVRSERTEPGGVSFDAERLWQRVVACLRELDAADEPVAALGIAAHVGTVLTDATFSPLGAAGGWADARGVELLARIDPQLLAASGRPAHTGGLLPSLLHLRERDAELFDSVRSALSPTGFLVARLTGVPSMDHTDAAYTLASDVRRRAWNRELLDACGIEQSVLPDQYASTSTVGVLDPSTALATGLPAGLRVIAGGPDGSTGAVAAIGSDLSFVADIAGTTDVLVKVTARPADAPAAAVVNPYPDGRHWSMGGSTGSTGGALSAWCRLLGLGTVGEALAGLGQAVAAAGVGAEGLCVQPELSGGRFPTWDPARRGSLSGLAERHEPAHIVRAVIEASAFLVREGVEALGVDASAALVLAGGAAKSAFLSQLRADALGRDVLVCDEGDVSLAGAAILAGVGCGLHSDIDAARAAGEPRTIRYSPDPARAARYDVVYEEWLSERGRPAGSITGGPAS